MPDQFGNPLPGETPPVVPFGAQIQSGMTGIDTGPVTPLPPVAPQVAPPPQQFNSLGVETNPPAPVAPPPAAPSAPETKPPTQFVSAPSAKAAQNPLAVVGYVPGGTSTSVTTTDLGPAGKKAEAALNEAGQSKIAAGTQLAAIQQEKADAGALAAAQRGDAAAKADSAIQLQQAKNNKDTAAHVEEMKRASDDYDRAAADLSPNHFWQVQSTGQKIGNLIAIAMSGIGNAFSARAGQNPGNGALAIINSAIDRDIDMQKTALAAKERGIRTKESLYQTLRQKGADDLSALEFTKAASLDQVSRQLDTAQAKASTKEAAANLADLQANVKAQQAEHLQRAAELTAKHVQSTSSSTPVTAMQMGQMNLAQDLAQRAQENQQMGVVERDPKMQVPGFGQAADSASRAELVKASLLYNPAEKALTVMEKLGRKAVLTPMESQAFETARQRYAGWVKGKYAQDLGQISQTDRQFIDPLLPTRDAHKLVFGQADQLLKDARENMNTAKQALMGYTVRTR